MPGFVPVANTSMAEIRFTVDGQACEITQAFHWTGTAPSAGELSALCAGLATLLVPRLRAVTHGGVIFREVYAKNLDTVAAAQATYTLPAGTAGQRAGDPCASNVACSIVKRTGYTGRSNKGRNSISGFSESDVTLNTISQALLTLLIQLAGQMLTTYVAGRFEPAVASRKNHTSVGLLGVAIMNDIVDSQKTRLPAHGN